MNGNNNGLKISFEKGVQELKTPNEVNFLTLVKNADITEVEEIKTLNSAFVPANFDAHQLKGALELYAEGVTASEMEKGVDNYLQKHPEVEAKARESLYAVPYLMNVFEEFGLKENSELQKQAASLIQIQQMQPISQVSRDNSLSFRISDGGFQPVLKEFVGVGTDLAKEKATSLLKNFAGKAIGTTGKKIAKEAAKKLTGLAVKAGIQAAASVAPIVGNIAAFIATEVLPKIAGKVIGAVKSVFSSVGRLLTGEKDFRKQVLWISGALAGGFLAMGMVIPAAAAGLVAFGAGASIVGGKAIGHGISGAGQAAIYGITHVAIPSIAAPTLIAILALPITVALILFIINSGAYLVPPSPADLYSMGSPYIKIEKKADPSGPFGNSALPRTITYTITVTATLSTLTNISFGWDCKVISEDKQFCPAYGNVTINGKSAPNLLPPTPPPVLSPAGDPFVIKYEQQYRRGLFEDSAIIDTFTVTADTEGATGVKSNGSAVVIFGKPPTGCFEFTPNNAPYFSEFQVAAAELASHISYITKLCDAGPITVNLNTAGPVTRGACAGASANSMFFNNCYDFQTQGQAFITYLFAHESGHSYDHRTEDFSRFQSQNILSEGKLPTYCPMGYWTANEDFAETIGDYIDNGRLSPLCAHPDQRPFSLCNSQFTQHCNFARDVIFNE